MTSFAQQSYGHAQSMNLYSFQGQQNPFFGINQHPFGNESPGNIGPYHPFVQEPITTQPRASISETVLSQAVALPGWMQPMRHVRGCPKGLEKLSVLDELYIKQDKYVIEMVTGWEIRDSYIVVNKAGQQCYEAFHASDMSCKRCLRTRSPFEVNVYDTLQEPVLSVERPFKVCGCYACLACSSCFQDEVTVSAADGTVLGKVRQAFACKMGRYIVYDADDKAMYEVETARCPCSWLKCSPVEYTITEKATRQTVGLITEEWSGPSRMREYFTNANFFGLHFPSDMDVRMKGTLLGLLFLIDYKYSDREEKHKVSMRPMSF